MHQPPALTWRQCHYHHLCTPFEGVLNPPCSSSIRPGARPAQSLFPNPALTAYQSTMSSPPPVVPLALLFVALAILSAGCSSTPATRPEGSGNGTIHASSEPAGAEIWLDGEYWGLTPGAISGIPAGRHTVEFRMDGYDSVSYPVTVVGGGMEGISATLTGTEGARQVTFAVTANPSDEQPQIHVDGYWLYPQGRSSTTNPVPGSRAHRGLQYRVPRCPGSNGIGKFLLRRTDGLLELRVPRDARSRRPREPGQPVLLHAAFPPVGPGP